MGSHSAIVRFMCTTCSTECKTGNVDHHLKAHSTSHQCEALLCGFTNNNPDDFLFHLRSHLQKRLECPTCGDIYGNPKAYLEHIAAHRETLFLPRIYYECLECKEAFPPFENLEECMKQHQWQKHGKVWDARSLPLSDMHEEVKDVDEDKDSKAWFENNADDDSNLFSYDAPPSTVDTNPSAAGNTGTYEEGGLRQVKSEKDDSYTEELQKELKKQTSVQEMYSAETSDDDVDDVDDDDDYVNDDDSDLSEEYTPYFEKRTPKRGKPAGKKNLDSPESSVKQNVDLKKETIESTEKSIVGLQGEPSKKKYAINILNRVKNKYKKNNNMKKLKSKSKTTERKMPKSYTCRICNTVFNVKRELVAHVSVHDVDRYACKDCDEKFRWKYQLRDHEKIHEKYPCKMCQEVYETKDELYEHQKSHDMFVYHCAHCDDNFKALKYLKGHLTRMHNMTLEGTEYESKDTEEDASLKNSKPREEVRDDSVACDQCDKVFKTYAGFREHHQEQHSDVYRRLCSLCGEKFKTTAKYTMHMRSHNASFECQTCHKVFTSIKKLKGHMNIKGCHRCDVCGMSFKSKYNMLQHKTIHTGEKPFKCTLCGRMFRQKYFLINHLRVHRGVRPFICSECGFKFATSTHLKRHMRTHTGSKPYVCNECGKAFALNPNLERHMRIHRGQKYACPLCDRKVTEKSNFGKHLKVHEKRGEKVPPGTLANAQTIVD